MEVSAAKPGLITAPGKPITSIFAKAANFAGLVPSIDRGIIVAAMLDQVIKGFDSDALLNDDLIRIGQVASDTTG